MAEDIGLAPTRSCCGLSRAFGWNSIGDPHRASLTDGVFLDTARDSDLDDLRQNEASFLIQLQALTKDLYANTLTVQQLEPLTSSVYGKMRFAQPLRTCSVHDPAQGTITLLAMGPVSTQEQWMDQGCWMHMSASLLANFYRIILVQPVPSSCRTAKAGLESLAVSTHTGSE